MTVFNVPRLCLAICIVQLTFVDFSCYDINSGVYRKEEKRIKKKKRGLSGVDRDYMHQPVNLER